jgi:hypothetical protein
VIPQQEEQEGRMKWICAAPQSFLQNGDKTLTWGTKNEDSVMDSSMAYRLLFRQPCFRYAELYTARQNKLSLLLTGPI